MRRGLRGGWLALVLGCTDSEPPLVGAGSAAEDGERVGDERGAEEPNSSAAGASSESEAADRPLTTEMEPAGSAEGSGQVADAADWVFDEGVLRTYSLSLDPVVWENLIATARDEVYVPASLLVDGESLTQVGLRFKGNAGTLDACFDESGALVCSKLSLKIKFDEYDPDQRLYGLKRLNFHSMRTDRSHMHERLAYRLFREMGIPAPRSGHARLIVNGEHRGVFALVEDIDGRFTKSRFSPGDGNLYKEHWPSTDDPTTLTERLETNEEAPDHAAMLAFHAALREAAPDPAADERASALAHYIDPGELSTYMAVDRVIENWDGVTTFYCFGSSCDNHNYFFYQHEAEPRFSLIPWDLDNTFDVSNEFDAVPDPFDASQDCNTRYPVFPGVAVRAPTCDAFFDGFARSERSPYRAALARLLDGPFKQEKMNTWLDAWQAQLEPAVSEDTQGPGLEAFRVAVGHLREDLRVLWLRAVAERDQQPIERFSLAPGEPMGFESTSELAVGLGVSRASTPETRFSVGLGTEGALSGARDLRLEFEFRDGATPWSQWAQLRLPLAAPSDLRQYSTLQLLVRSDRPRRLRIALDSSAYTDTGASERAHWDVELDGSLQRLLLALSSASFTGGGSDGPGTLDDVLASVTAFWLEPAPEGRGEEGYLGAGVSDAGVIQLDEIELLP